MKQKITLIAGLILSLNVATASAAPARSYLYAMTGTHGYIKQINTGSYQLHITLPATNQVTMFSDRPYRVVQPISGLELEKIWHQGGKQSFAANPPNAVLEIAGKPARIVTLTHLQVEGRQATYTISANKTHLPNQWISAHNLLTHITIG